MSNTYGPTQRTGQVWGCFQKSPTGTAFAATYIMLSSGEAGSWNFYTIGYPKLAKNKDSGNGDNEVIGFKVKAYKPGDALIDLAIKGTSNGQTGYIELPAHMVWVDGTWKATTEGLYSDTKLRVLSGIEDFIPWSTS